MVMPVGDLLPELVLLAGGVLVLLYALFTPRRAQVHAASFAVLVLAATGAASVATVGGRQRLTFFDTYAVDGAAFWGKLIVLGVTLITVLLSVDWFREDARQGEYYPILLFSALGAILLAGATDLMELILAVLLASATGYVLAAYHRHSKASAEAAIKYYLLGAITNGAMLYGAALLFGVAATTTFPGLRTGLANAQGWLVAVGFALVFLGVAFKMGAVPTHAWMPDVAEGAPAPAAAFLTVAAKVGALIVLARLVRVLPEAAVGWRPLIALVAAATMTLGNLAALWQDDVRRLLGWSSVSQTGYGLMAIVALDRSELALPALLFFLVAYALGNLAAFGVVIALRGLTDRRAFAGLARTRPLLAFALTLAFLSLVGVPPLAGFTAKLMLFAATIDAGYTWLAVVAIVNSVVSLAYYARVLGPAYFDTPAARPARLGPWAMLATGVCAAGLIIVGLGAQFFMDAFASIRLLP
jgi:NADH-quinone oxidoreductase subunit N